MARKFALNENRQVLSMYEGIKVASDAVNHAILLKLERYGVNSHSLQRFNSYLTDRKVRVRIGNSFSDEQN